MVENIIVHGSTWVPEDLGTLFPNEGYLLTTTDTLEHLTVKLGIYKSTSEARRAGRYGPIPKGYTEFKASKTRMLYIWNPTT